MGASLRTAWSASGATGASDSNVFVHEDVDFSYEEILIPCMFMLGGVVANEENFGG